MRKEDFNRLMDEEREKRNGMTDRELLIRIDERQAAACLRANNHGDRILRIELAIVAGLVAAVAAGKDAIMSLIGHKGHP